MGQSLTRLPDLPTRPPTRSTRVKTSSRHLNWAPLPHTNTDGSSSASRAPRHGSSKHSEKAPRRQSRSDAQSRTNKLPRRTTASTKPSIRSRSDSNSRPRRETQIRRPHVPKSESQRNRKAASRHHIESIPEPKKTQPHTHHARPKSKTHDKTKHSTLSKSKARSINVSVTSLRDEFTKQDCIICTESRPSYRFPSQTPTSTCAHPSSTCKKCLRQWIATQFSSKVWNQIDCPECGARMQHEDMKRYAPKHIFKRYDELSARATMEAIPGFRWCIIKGCKSGQVHNEDNGGKLVPRFKCNGCGKSHCIVHGVKWHKRETCAEYDYRTDGTQKKAEDTASRKLIKDTAKKCPGCKWHITKHNGCDHMTCSKCKHEFCWECTAPYEPIIKQGNQMHKPVCKYFDNGTPNYV